MYWISYNIMGCTDFVCLKRNKISNASTEITERWSQSFHETATPCHDWISVSNFLNNRQHFPHNENFCQNFYFDEYCAYQNLSKNKYIWVIPISWQYCDYCPKASQRDKEPAGATDGIKNMDKHKFVHQLHSKRAEGASINIEGNYCR